MKIAVALLGSTFIIALMLWIFFWYFGVAPALVMIALGVGLASRKEKHELRRS